MLKTMFRGEVSITLTSVLHTQHTPKGFRTPKMAKRVRSWVFTLYADEDGQFKLCLTFDAMRYYCFQKEICPTTQRVHLQGLLYLENPITLSALKKQLCSSTIHLEPMKGTFDQARDYCMKSETAVPDSFVERGERPAPGKRSDLALAAERILRGDSVLEVIRTDPQLVRNIAHLQHLRQISHLSTERDVKCYWIYGPPGCGKTRFVHKRFASLASCCLTVPMRFDEYDGQGTLLLDDVQPHHLKMNRELMLKVCDRYPFSLPARYNNRPALYTYVVFTSNYVPEFVGDLEAFDRRIKIVPYTDNLEI